MKFFFEGPPTPKARHKTRVVGRRVYSYDPQDKQKKLAKNYVLEEITSKDFTKISDGPIAVSVLNYVQIPRSLSKKKQKALEGQFCEKRPDVDNYVKWIFDVLNDLSYKDDGQVALLLAKKIYAEEPKMIVEVKKLSDHTTDYSTRISKKIDLEQIAYLIDKANFLGLQGRVINNISCDIEGDEVHIKYKDFKLG